MPRATIPIAVQPNTRVLQIHRDPYTRVWLIYLSTRNVLVLHPCGKMERVHIEPDGTETTGVVKPSDVGDS